MKFILLTLICFLPSFSFCDHHTIQGNMYANEVMKNLESLGWKIISVKPITAKNDFGMYDVLITYGED